MIFKCKNNTFSQKFAFFANLFVILFNMDSFISSSFEHKGKNTNPKKHSTQ